jgi:hypothetical protein
MATTLFRPVSSNCRSGLLLSVFAVFLSGTSRGELACRITRTYPPFCKALTSASAGKFWACAVPANHRIATTRQVVAESGGLLVEDLYRSRCEKRRTANASAIVIYSPA